VFYPRNYVIAVFDSFEAAEHTEQVMLGAGYDADEVHAVTGNCMLAEHEKLLEDQSWLERAKRQISKAVGKEVDYVDEGVRLAREGAGFLGVFCPTEHESQRVLRLIKPLKSKKMRCYLPLAIEEMV
jgi:hypothetical protein